MADSRLDTATEEGQTPRERQEASEAGIASVDAGADGALASPETVAGERPAADGVASDDEAALSVGRSTALMSVLVVVSRLSGFARTWAEAFAMGATVLASCYELASNLPAQIYELVTAGMLVTAFLPVYVSVKKRLGQKSANDYVSNLLSIVALITGLVTVVSFIFAGQIIWSQSFNATEEFDTARAVWFFRFFVIEIVLYASSTIIQGAINAERDFLWTSIAPIFNNLVVMSSFIIYGFIADSNPGLGLLVLAIGNPLGVLVQLLLQLPSLRRHGIRLRFHVDFHDPALVDTLRIGGPTVAVMIFGFVTNSFHMSAFLSFTPLGASIGTYAMLWFNLPYAVFCVPIMTVLFTELADSFASGDIDSFSDTVAHGASEIAFMLIPFALFLALFSHQLIAIISASRFDPEAAELCAYYLAWRALSLPVMGLSSFLQKVCSSTRKMGIFMWVTLLCSVIQILLVQFVAPVTGFWMIPFSSFVFYFVFDVVIFLQLQRTYHHIGLMRIAKGVLRSVVFGAVGAAVAWGVMLLLGRVMGPFNGTLVQGILYCVCAGIPAVLVTYGAAVVLKAPEARTVNIIADRLLRRG